MTCARTLQRGFVLFARRVGKLGSEPARVQRLVIRVGMDLDRNARERRLPGASTFPGFDHVQRVAGWDSSVALLDPAGFVHDVSADPNLGVPAMDRDALRIVELDR